MQIRHIFFLPLHFQKNKDKMNVNIINIGDELLIGQVTNTNATIGRTTPRTAGRKLPLEPEP